MVCSVPKSLIWNDEDEDGCNQVEVPAESEHGGQPLQVNVSSQGQPASLVLNWGTGVPAGRGYVLRLTRLGFSAPLEKLQLQVGPNASGFQFQDLIPGSHYQLEVTVLLPCSQNSTITLTAQTTPSPVHNLTLRNSGSPSRLEATWESASGQLDDYQLLLYHLESQTLAWNISVTPGTLSCHFGSLLPGSEYALWVTTWAGDLYAKTSIRQWTTPTPPEHLALFAMGTSALQASWSRAEGAAWFHLTLLDLLDGAILTAVAQRGTTNHTFYNLSMGTPYQLSLDATSGLFHIGGPNATAWTYPSVPSDLLLTPWPPGLSASWQAGPGHLDGYLLRLSGQVERNSTLGPEALNTTFPGPLPAGHYTLELTALAGPHGASAQADAWLEFPATPANLSLGSEGKPSTLTAHWSPPPGSLDGYRLWLYHLAPLGLKGKEALSSDIQSFSWSRLPRGVEFMVQLVALRGVDESDVINATAWTYPEAPVNLTLFNVGSPEVSALLASWKPSGAQSFELTLYQLPLGNATHRVILMGNVTNYTFWGLEPGTAYTLRAGGIGGPYQAWAPNLTSWTLPLAPAMVNVTSEDPTRLRVSWDQASGSLDGHRVTLRQEGTTVSTRAVGPEVNNISFSSLTPGTKYWVEIVSLAGPHHSAAANVTSWTPPLVPKELSVTMQGASAMVALTWAAVPRGQEECQAQLLESGQLFHRQPVSLGQARFILRGLTPGHTFFFSVLCQAGPLQASTSPIVLLIEPRPVEDVQCQSEATHLALNWTVPVGEAGTCLVVAEQLGTGGKAQPVFSANTSQNALRLPGLTPAASYRLSLTLLGRNGLWSQTVTVLCTTSPEAWHPPEMAAAPHLESAAGAGVVITRDMFGEDNGRIQWYGVIATTNASLIQPSQEAISHTWYDHYYRGLDSYLAVLLPSPFRPGPWAMPRSWTVPVGTEDCGQTQQTCNGKLKPDAQYRFSVAAFTSSDSVNPTVSFTAFSEPRASVSGASMPLLVASGIVSGCLFTLGAVLGLLCCRRMRVKRAEKNYFSQEMTPYTQTNIHRPILRQNFRQSYEAKKVNSHYDFFREFEELKEVGKELPKVEAENPANAIKNRYPHVLPYDHSRVRLTFLDDEPHSDYINANFIPGYTRPQEFIATQGPLKKTMEDFWRLVWEQQVHTIVMLTVGMENGRVLCEHYWPVDSKPVTYGQIIVRLVAEEKGEDWTCREFQVQHGSQEQERRIEQLQFLAWPDHGVPEAPSSLVSFAELVQERIQAAPSTAPTLVHCSAGVGRTGTFVALVRLLQQLQEEQMVDVLHTVYTLRQSRPLMIQTLAQYIFLHSCLLEKIMEEPAGSLVSRPINVKNFSQKHAKKLANSNAGFLREYELLLEAIKDQGKARHPVGSTFSLLLPYEHRRVEQSPTDSLQPWFFPGKSSIPDQVALAGPAKAEEFWQLVWKHGAHVLVSLRPLDTQNEEWCPALEQPICTKTLTVRCVVQSDMAGWFCLHLNIKHEKKEKELGVRLLQFPSWESGQEPPAQVLLSFLAAVDQCYPQVNRKKPKTILVYSSSGRVQLGIFLAVERLLEQAKFWGSVDIFGVVLQLARACGSMTPTLDQYIYLYSCVGSALANELA
ncbi:receptor-type tyrosine-protein phosphatase V-like isoform X5 [Phascolarctos cinereus]